MSKQMEISKWQTGLLVTLRFLIGWHLLYEGLFKLLKPEWSSHGFLEGSQWILSGIAGWIASNPSVLSAVDFLNTWGLICIGLGLILGLFTRSAAIAGALLIGLYYLFNPPLVGITTLAPMEGNYLIVNKNLIEAVMLLLLAASPAARSWGLDSLFANRKGK
jgi:thiosulfate dehydrogenase [quinone] large subunit